MTVVTNPACTPDSLDSAPLSDEELCFPDDPEAEETLVVRDYLITPPTPSDRFSWDYYNSELRHDVMFLAGYPGDRCRFPGHRLPLTEYYTGLRYVLNDNPSDTVVIDYVDRRGFEQFMSYLYLQPNTFDTVSVQTARLTLDTAFKLLCPHLLERAARRLDMALEPGLALELLPDLRYMCTMLPGTASAPCLTAFKDNLRPVLMARCSSLCDKLAHNALLVIDEHADRALRDERFEDLQYEEVALIVRRDTLRVSSEMVLIEALSRWATTMCHKYDKEVTSENKRTALGELAYCPRYLLLEPGKELERALAFELLQPAERALVLSRARKLPAPAPVGVNQERMLLEWAQCRPTSPAALPVTLSPRSVNEPESPRPPRRRRWRWCCSSPSPPSPKRIRAPDLEPPEFARHPFRTAPPRKETCCSCFGTGILRALICLFD